MTDLTYTALAALVLIFAFAIRCTCSGLATATLATYRARISVTAVALPVASTTMTPGWPAVSAAATAGIVYLFETLFYVRLP